jgi:hypothetical protein
MKTISIKQPWAELIITGVKDVENRNWPTDYRGPIIIHTGQRIDPYGADQFVVETARALRKGAIGAIIGHAYLYACGEKQYSKWHEDKLTGFYLANPIEIPPIPYSGKLSLFEVDPALVGIPLCARCGVIPSLPANHLCACCVWHTEHFGATAPTQTTTERQQYATFLRDARKRSFDEERMQ